jgi:hypothetical protein
VPKITSNGTETTKSDPLYRLINTQAPTQLSPRLTNITLVNTYQLATQPRPKLTVHGRCRALKPSNGTETTKSDPLYHLISTHTPTQLTNRLTDIITVHNNPLPIHPDFII